MPSLFAVTTWMPRSSHSGCQPATASLAVASMTMSPRPSDSPSAQGGSAAALRGAERACSMAARGLSPTGTCTRELLSQANGGSDTPRSRSCR